MSYVGGGWWVKVHTLPEVSTQSSCFVLKTGKVQRSWCNTGKQSSLSGHPYAELKGAPEELTDVRREELGLMPLCMMVWKPSCMK